MDGVEISIIIPTYNRKNILKKCLMALFAQALPKERYEIIIIDDGSTDGTSDMINEEIQKNVDIRLKYFKQENKGPASARNIGIKQARGDILLFMGDDIFATPDLLEQHIAFHFKQLEQNVAMLGYVTWSPEIKVTPFMFWLEHGGPQFSYHKFKPNEKVNSFWTCNISLKRNFMIKEGVFDESFPYAAHEDTELGYRLQKKGLQIVYGENAIAYHYHSINIEKYCYRQKLVGKSFVILNKKYPLDFKLLKKNGKWKNKVWGIIQYWIPYLKKTMSWLDQKNIKLPYILYELIMYYYYQKDIQ